MEKHNPTVHETRKFCLILSCLLFGLAAMRYLKHHQAGMVWLVGGSVVSFLVAVLVPAAAQPFHRLVLAVTRAVGWFNTRVILILVYVFILVPIGLIRRLLRRDSFSKAIDKKADSYWVKREVARASKESLTKQF